MATFFNTAYSSIDTNTTTVLTSSADSTIVLSILVANKNGTTPADVTCVHTTNANVVRNNIAFTIPVPADANLDLIGNKYILPSGTRLRFSASTSGVLDVAVSYVQV